MVKPPKSMQPESVDLNKAGRKSGKSFKQDSFHNYMARKIDLQRSQFGLLLPPPPPPSGAQTSPRKSPTKSRLPSPHNSFSSPKSPKSRKRPRPPSSNSSNKNKAVTFAALPLRVEKMQTYEEDDDDEDEDESSPHGMSAILKNLKQRHGRGCRRVLSRHGKRKSRPHKTGSKRPHLKPPPCQEESSSPVEGLSETEQQQVDGEDDPNSTKLPQEEATTLPDFIDNPIHCTVNESEELSTPSSTLKLRRDRPDLFFLGIVVKVNGYTDPDNETIKRLLQRYGGDFETYETERVTHIVAEHMSTAKANYLKQQRRPRPVVLPSWILDSVEAGKLLPHGDYLLEELQDNPSTTGGRQIGINDLFSGVKKTAPTDPKKIHPPSQRDEALSTVAVTEKIPILERQDSSSSMEVDVAEELQKETSIDILPLTQAEKMSDDDNSTEDEEDDGSIAGPVQVIGIDGDCSHAASTKPVDQPQHEFLNTIWSKESGTEQVQRDDSSEKPSIFSPQKVLAQPLGKTDGKHINGMIRTVGTDPNFLDSFFANSRLSFIGSYKQRTSNTEASNTIASPQGKRVQSKECYKRFVFHVDMDCFFANVVLRKYPQYRDKPVAISHHGKKHNAGSDPMIDHDPNSANKSEKSTSECATCNYHARKFGIKKGMFLGRARQLCPELIVLHYDFAGYEEVSEQVLAILQRVAAEHEGCVEAVSCDEAYMELHLPRVDELGHMSGGSSTADDNAGDIAEMVRKEIFETTQCTASVGVASNKFLAKVGTDRVKPDGTFVVNDYRNLLKELSLRDLHGVGYRSEPKLLAEGLASVQDVWELGSKAESALSKILGPGLGKKIYAFCHGRDDRKVQPVERKTIGAECNYGVRFDGPYGIDYFVNGLALEVGKRMEGVGCKGCKLTLKVKQRKTGAKPPPKFLGHGSCHNLSKSMDVPDSFPTRDAKILAEVGMLLFRGLAVPLDDVRGMGIVVSKLSSASDDGRNRSPSKNVGTAGIDTFFGNAAKQKANITLLENYVSCEEPERHKVIQSDQHRNVPELSSEGGMVETDHLNLHNDIREKTRIRSDDSSLPGVDVVVEGHLELPPLSQICMSQVAALPPEIQEEIHSRFASHERKQPASPEAASNAPIDVDEIQHPTSTAGPFAAGAKESHLAVSAFGNERHQFRQTSLKRMMKLAAVKSGQGNSGMSLAELRRLPLEIQLQIANQDSNPVGLLSQKTRNSSHAGNLAKSRQAMKDERKKSSVAGEKQASKRVREIDLTNERNEVNKSGNESPSRNEADDGPIVPTDLFDDDIIPLCQFLDQNSPSNAEAISTVGDFLRTCLKERRMNDIPALVRSIKKRQDEWSKRPVLLQIVHDLDELHERMYNARLDIDWLLRE